MLETVARREDGEYGRLYDGFAGSSPPFLGRERAAVVLMLVRSAAAPFPDDEDDVHYYIRWRLKLDERDVGLY